MLPLARVRKAVRLDPAVGNISKEGLLLLTKATEVFMTVVADHAWKIGRQVRVVYVCVRAVCGVSVCLPVNSYGVLPFYCAVPCILLRAMYFVAVFVPIGFAGFVWRRLHVWSKPRVSCCGIEVGSACVSDRVPCACGTAHVISLNNLHLERVRGKDYNEFLSPPPPQLIHSLHLLQKDRAQVHSALRRGGLRLRGPGNVLAQGRVPRRTQVRVLGWSGSLQLLPCWHRSTRIPYHPTKKSLFRVVDTAVYQM